MTTDTRFSLSSLGQLLETAPKAVVSFFCPAPRGGTGRWDEEWERNWLYKGLLAQRGGAGGNGGTSLRLRRDLQEDVAASGQVRDVATLQGVNSSAPR